MPFGERDGERKGALGLRRLGVASDEISENVQRGLVRVGNWRRLRSALRFCLLQFFPLRFFPLRFFPLQFFSWHFGLRRFLLLDLLVLRVLLLRVLVVSILVRGFLAQRSQFVCRCFR